MCFLSLGQSSLLLTLTFLCLAWSAGLPRAPEAVPGDRQSLPLRAHGQGQVCCQRLPENESQVGPHLTASRRSSRAELRRRSLARAAGQGTGGTARGGHGYNRCVIHVEGLRPVLFSQTKMGQVPLSAQL